MQFTEFEMTTMIHGVAKTQVAYSARTTDTGTGTGTGTGTDIVPDGEEIAAAWQHLSKIERYQIVSGLSAFVLPILPLLPERSPQPGERATYTAREVFEAAHESAQSDIAMDKMPIGQAETLAVHRANITMLALDFLPPKPTESADDDMPVVPDSPEGLLS